MEGKIMFVGREKELKIIDTFLSNNHGALLVYGLRRVGKTTLMKKLSQIVSVPILILYA